MSRSTVNALTASVCCLALLSGCTTTKDAQGIGQLAGALGGALLGSQIGGGTGKIFAAVAGAAVGAWIGGEIAKALSERDQQALQAETQTTLANVPDNQTIVWTAPESGKTVKITPSATRQESRQVAMKRIDRVAPPPAGFQVMDEVYVTSASVRLRATPTTSADNVVGSFKAGDQVRIAGRVPNAPWYLVSRNGTAIGYVSADYVQPAPAGQVATAPLETAPVMEGGMNLDTLPVAEMQVSAVTDCREVTYNLDDATQSVTSCKAPDGAWSLS